MTVLSHTLWIGVERASIQVPNLQSPPFINILLTGDLVVQIFMRGYSIWWWWGREFEEGRKVQNLSLGTSEINFIYKNLFIFSHR